MTAKVKIRRTGLLILLVSVFSVSSFSQQNNYSDSLPVFIAQKQLLKPIMHYSAATTFITSPGAGSLAGFTVSPSVSLPVTQRLSFHGGVIAGRYYSLFRASDPVGFNPSALYGVSVYGAASYQLTSKLTLFGSGVRRVTNSPLSLLPKSSYTIGSSLKLGSVSISAAFSMSEWNDNLSPFGFNSSRGFYQGFGQRPGVLSPFGF